MKQWCEFFRKESGWVLLVGAVFIGAFFRLSHFSEWLLFKGDAFRDAVLASNIHRVGWESLPLLGPRAGGTMLHLGPIFYYFQALAVWLFQSLEAPVLAYPDVLFSILTIPVFFFFTRRFFSGLWSGTLSLLLATSFLAIEYGRFGWNPNATLFFTLVFSLAILTVYEDGPVSGEKRRAFWALLAGLSGAIASQLHFSAFLGLPILLIAFGLWHGREARRILTFRVVALFFLGVLIVYLPVIFSEYLKHGENTQQFLAALSSKSSEQGIVQNVVVVAIVFAKYFLRISLGIIESGQTLIMLAGLAGLGGFLANIFLLRGEEDERKRNFLQWTLLLTVVYFLLYIPLADKIDRPRFFLPLLVLPYLFFGYVMVVLRRKFPTTRIVPGVAVLGVAIILFGNVSAVTKWFVELETAQHLTALTESKNTKGKNFLLTWGHFERVAETMATDCSGEAPIIVVMAKRIGEYGHSVEYALKERGQIPLLGAEKMFREASPRGCYYFVSLPGEPSPAFVTTQASGAPLLAGGIQATRFFPSQATLEFVPDETKEMMFVPEKITRNSRVYWGDVANLFRE